MAEVQKTVLAGDLAQRFIEYVLLQSQQISLLLGRIPNPQTGRPEVHLEAARLFIDQLDLIREKTRGNLSGEETQILDRVLADLQAAYVQASAQG